MEGVGLTTISSFGIVGNIMSIIVLTRRHSAFVRCGGRTAQSEGLTAGRSLCVQKSPLITPSSLETGNSTLSHWHRNCSNGVTDIPDVGFYSHCCPLGRERGTGGSDRLRPKQCWVFAQCLCFSVFACNPN